MELQDGLWQSGGTCGGRGGAHIHATCQYLTQVFVAINHVTHHRALRPARMTPSSVVQGYNISPEHTALIFSIKNRILVENLRNDLPD
jgi:hypothetical protein